MRRLQSFLACLVPLALLGCGSDTVLSANFDRQPLGTPERQQQVGRFRLGDFGRVEVVRAPKILAFEDAGNWVKITQFQEVAPRTRYRGTFARFKGDGKYLATVILFIPEGMSASVGFEGSSGFPGQPFLEVGFPANGVIRQPPASGPIWGRFPHDRRFSLAVSLNAAPSSTATLTLLGAARGSVDIALSELDSAEARLFGHVNLFTGGKIDDEFFLVKSLAVVHTPPGPAEPVLEQ